jgi:hypothetical protein
MTPFPFRIELGEANSNGSGDWETPLITVTDFNCFAIFTMGKYGSEPVSIPPKKFTVAIETPIIKEVREEVFPIPDNGTTYERSVTIHADAVPNQDAKAFDGKTELKSGLANGCGNSASNSSTWKQRHTPSRSSLPLVKSPAFSPLQ